MRFGGSPDTHIAAVEHGTADLASDFAPLSPAVLAAAETRYAGQLKVNPLGITNYIALNTRIPPFNDLRARQALNFAIDRQRLTALTVGQSLGVVTCQILPPNFDGYRRICPYTTDPNRGGTWTAPDLARARKLVRLSGTAGEAVTFWIPRCDQLRSGRGQVRRLGARQPRLQGAVPLRARPVRGRGQAPRPGGFRRLVRRLRDAGGFIGPTLTCSSYDKADPANNTTPPSSATRRSTARSNVPSRSRRALPKPPRGCGPRSTATSSTRRRGSPSQTATWSSSSRAGSATTSSTRSG